MNDQQKQAAESLELFATNDRRTIDAFDRLYKRASTLVDLTASRFAEFRREWHDDPKAENYAEFQAPTFEQFDDEARAAVVVALFERCERIRQENILNGVER